MASSGVTTLLKNASCSAVNTNSRAKCHASCTDVWIKRLSALTPTKSSSSFSSTSSLSFLFFLLSILASSSSKNCCCSSGLNVSKSGISSVNISSKFLKNLSDLFLSLLFNSEYSIKPTLTIRTPSSTGATPKSSSFPPAIKRPSR